MSSSSDWEEIPSGAQSDSPSGSRHRSKRRPGTNNASDVLPDSRDDSPLNSQLRSAEGGSVVPSLQKKNPPRNESFTMIDTPRGPRDRNLQAHSVSIPPAAVAGSGTDESLSTSPDQKQDPIINPTGLPPRPPLHNNPPSPMTKKQLTVTILNGVDASTPQQTTPLSLEQRSPGATNSAFPRIPPPRTHSQGSVSNINNNILVNPHHNHQQHKPLGLFPSAASMDSLVGGPQSLHFSPNTPQHQGQWKDVTGGVAGGGGPTPGSSMSMDCTPFRTYPGEQLGMESRNGSSNWGDAPSQSCESAPRDTTTTENSAVRNHQASLFSSVLAGFDERSRERSNSPLADAAKNVEPEGSENDAVAAPQATRLKDSDEEETMEGLTNQPTSEFREASADRSSQMSHPIPIANQASEARAKAAAESRKATVESLTARTGASPPALRQHRWRPYLLRVYRWQTPRHSIVAVALVVSFTTIVLPTIFVGIGPFRFLLFGFALMQTLSGVLLLLAGVPQLQPLLVRCGVLETSKTTVLPSSSAAASSATSAAATSSDSCRRQARKFIAKTIKTKAAALYEQSNIRDAIPQFGGYLWDKLLELADPTEAVQGEHEAAIKLIHSDRKRRQSLQLTPNKYLDPFANVQPEEEETINTEEEDAMEILLQQSAYFDSAATSAVAAPTSHDDKQKKKLATMEGLVQEALRTERHALAKKLFLMLAAAIVVIEPVLDWAVNDASSPTSTFLFLLGVFICGRYPIRKIMRREYIRRYGVTAGPFTQRTGAATTSTGATAPSSPQATTTTISSNIKDQDNSTTTTSTNNKQDDDQDDLLQRTFMDTVTASVRSFVIGPLEDEVEDSEVFSGRPSEEFHHSSPSPPSTPNARNPTTATPAASPTPDDLLKQTMRDINRRRTLSAMNPPSPRLLATTPLEAPVPLTVKWVVADACLLAMMGLGWAVWKLAARTILVG